MNGLSPEHPDTVIGRIRSRRERAGHDAMETFPDTPLEVIAWVIAHPDASRAVLHDDLLDCFTLDAWIRLTLDKRESSLADLSRPGRDSRLTWREIAGALGLKSPQGAQQRIERLKEGLAGRARDEKKRRAELSAQLDEEGWLAVREGDIREAARAWIAAAADGAPEVAEILEDPGATTRMLMVWIAGDLRGNPPGLCPQAEALVAEWDDLSREGS